MAITIRHDAAAVALPANSAQRKYGQSLVLQQQQQKYAAQQAANDRLFSALQQQQPARNNWQWGGNAQQGRPQGGAIIQQGGQQRGFGLTTTVDAQKQAMADAEQRKKDFEAARSRIDTYAKDMLANGEIADQETKNKIRNLIAGKTIVMGHGFDETARQNYLEQYNAELAKILSEVPPPKPQAPPQPNFHTDQNGNQWVESGPGKWEQVPVQPTQPASAAEALKANPKLQSDYRNQAAGILAGPDGDKAIPGSTPEEQRAAVNALAMKLYEQDQKDFGGSQAAAQAPPVAEQVPSAPAGIPIAPPDPGQPPSPSPQGPTIQPPDPGQPPSPAPPRKPLPLVSNEGSQNPAYQTAGGQQTQPQQVTVGGKPLAVTPGTLTPQETAARGQIMELPREQRIAALMPYDQELKGRTLEQLLEDPETKAGYAEMTKQGLTTGNYREDMLGHIDEMLQHNVLNAAGQSPPNAYVGMRADEVTDPKAKAEVDKMPRPKTADEMKAVRGKYFIDPNGIIRGTQKQA